jgi:hypothetical protein
MAKPVSAVSTTSPDQRIFDLRWQRSEADLMEPLRLIYGEHPKFAGFVYDLKERAFGKR